MAELRQKEKETEEEEERKGETWIGVEILYRKKRQDGPEEKQ